MRPLGVLISEYDKPPARNVADENGTAVVVFAECSTRTFV